MEDRIDRNAKLVVASGTQILVALFNPVNLLALAAWASDTVRPAQLFKVGTALCFISEVAHHFNEVH